MLETLCGNKSVERILFFLFVNEKCYGAQLQRLLSVPLTPIQKALSRLEKQGVVASFYEGKTRVYEFNPEYPLHEELGALLRKAYSLLSPQEKKRYYFVKYKSSLRVKEAQFKREESLEYLLAFWMRLSNVRRLKFYSKSKTNLESGCNGIGKGEVVVIGESDSALLFQEKGSWKGENGQEMAFSNSFRWTLDRVAGMIYLEHLRYGANYPVFLFHLIPSGKNSLESLDSHLCEKDAYFGRVTHDKERVELQWRIIGPKKDEEITYCYV